MLKHFKDKMIEDDRELGEQDDYIGPGIIVSLVITIGFVLFLSFVLSMLFGSVV